MRVDGTLMTTQVKKRKAQVKVVLGSQEELLDLAVTPLHHEFPLCASGSE